MTDIYEICVRDARAVLQQQLDTDDFRDKFQTRPFRQFRTNKECVWTSVFSGEWAWDQVVSSTSL